jgi:hypothetical protein
MRTTLVVDDDVLAVARQRAATTGETLGRALSQLARAGIESAAGDRDRRTRNGVLLLPRRSGGRAVTPDDVSALRDEIE